MCESRARRWAARYFRPQQLRVRMLMCAGGVEVLVAMAWKEKGAVCECNAIGTFCWLCSEATSFALF